VSDKRAPSSPLDPFLKRFLMEIGDLDQGYQPGAGTSALATSLDLPRAFVEALFTSARTRALVKPQYGRGGRPAWVVSPSGQRFLDNGTGSDTAPA